MSMPRKVVFYVTGLLLIVGLLILAAFVLPYRMVTRADVPVTVDRLKAQNDIRATLLQTLAGLTLLLGAVFTARTYALNKRGQITDRFTKAINQLADKSLDVRLGGIYALERIAEEGSGRDHWSIMEVLTAFLREHYPANAEGPPSGKRGASPVGSQEPSTQRTDAQAVLTVIGRRLRRKGEPGRLDLRNIDAAGANLRGAHLERALLWRADLEGVNLRDAHLERANLMFAQLIGANLEGAHLEGANLRAANLRAAHLAGAHLEGAHLGGANLQGANLPDAHLQRANLRGANLERTYLEGAHEDPKTIWPDGFDSEAARSSK